MDDERLLQMKEEIELQQQREGRETYLEFRRKYSDYLAKKDKGSEPASPSLEKDVYFSKPDK